MTPVSCTSSSRCIPMSWSPRATGERLRTPLCLDETVARRARGSSGMALNGPKVWNIKVHRVGGLSEVCRIYRLAAEYGAQLWAGTMPESGIGSQVALAAAALPLFVYPPISSPPAAGSGAMAM